MLTMYEIEKYTKHIMKTQLQ